MYPLIRKKRFAQAYSSNEIAVFLLVVVCVLPSILSPTCLQAVTLLGSNFGPSVYPNSTGYISISYGGGSTNGLTFSAGSCGVTSPSSMTCLTGTGIGMGLGWQLTVGGQVSGHWHWHGSGMAADCGGPSKLALALAWAWDGS